MLVVSEDWVVAVFEDDFDEPEEDAPEADESEEPDDFGEEADDEGESDEEDDDLEEPVVAFLPIESFRPGWISAGSEPTASRLSA